MKKFIIPAALVLFPFVALAQGTGVEGLLVKLQRLIDIVTPIVFALTFLAFFWGLFKYILGGAENKDQGRNIMIWAVVALFVMVSIFGIIRLLQETFGIRQTETINLPKVPPR